MAPRAGARGLGPARPPKPQGFVRNTYNEITSPENRSIVTALTVFTLGVAFLSSSWSEMLLPPI